MFLRFFLITIKEKQFFHSMLSFFSVPRFFPALALVCLAACLLTVLTCLINCAVAWFLACLPIFFYTTFFSCPSPCLFGCLPAYSAYLPN
jgi:ABC-type sulfate transport system permease component